MKTQKFLNSLDDQLRHHVVTSAISAMEDIARLEQNEDDRSLLIMGLQREADLWCKTFLPFDREIGAKIWDLTDAMREDFMWKIPCKKVVGAIYAAR